MGALVNRLIGALFLIFGIGLQPTAATSAAPTQSGRLELAVKASYLAKFGPFVDWPPRALPPSEAPMNLCLVGEDPFGALLDEAVVGQQVDGHPIAISRFSSIDRDKALACQILYLGRPAEQSTNATLGAVAGLPVLTVSDLIHGVAGGMIEFVLIRGRVRFEVDQARARANGLNVSAKLLALAVKVRRG